MMGKDAADTVRNKHKDHWKPFDRKNPPKFMVCGEIGIDDKRKLCKAVCGTQLMK